MAVVAVAVAVVVVVVVVDCKRLVTKTAAIEKV